MVSLPSSRSEESSEIGDDATCHTGTAARWLRLSAADVSAIRESIHLDASSTPPQHLSSPPASHRHQPRPVHPLSFQRSARGDGLQPQQRARSPGACVRESIHVEGGVCAAAMACDEKEACWGREEEGEWVRESLNVPSSPAKTLSHASAYDCWAVESPRKDVGAGGGGGAAVGSEGGLSGTLSIVERIKHLDQQKKQAVARCSGAAVLQGLGADALLQVAGAARERGCC